MSVEKDLMNILMEYTEELGDTFNKELKTIGKETSSGLKDTSRSMFRKTNHAKHYADGWTYKTQGKGLDSGVTIYNKTKPSLTHLLENGHEVYPHGRANPHPHIEPAQIKATNTLMERLQHDL